MSASADRWLATFDRLDAALVKAGWPATSPWWRSELERFIRSGKRRWVIRVGRRGGKSSTLCRVAITQALSGGWSVPPGDVAVISFTSLDRDEASSRIRTISQALTALGIEHESTTDEITIPSRRLVFRVSTCSIRSVGFTSIMLVGDEMARWESRDSAANPAREVMASQRPTMATQPCGFEVCCGSPWSTDDYHAELFDAGETASQCVSFAPTWLANPTISEATTHELEPDDRVWSREYAAIPGGTLSAALDAGDVAAAFIPLGECHFVTSAVIAIDASSLRGDAFAWLVAHETPTGLLVSSVSGIEGPELKTVSMTAVVDRIAEVAQSVGATTVFADQREEASLRSLFRERHLEFVSFAWSEPSKDSAFQTLRRLLRERQILLPEHDTLKREMLSVKAHLLPSGRTKYATNGLDYLSALVTLIHAVDAGHVLLTPTNEESAVGVENCLVSYLSPLNYA